MAGQFDALGASLKVADTSASKGLSCNSAAARNGAPLSGQMRAEQIGALVVSRDRNSIEGIVSERDLAYGLATYGGSVANDPSLRFDHEGSCCLLT